MTAEGEALRPHAHLIYYDYIRSWRSLQEREPGDVERRELFLIFTASLECGSSLRVVHLICTQPACTCADTRHRHRHRHTHSSRWGASCVCARCATARQSFSCCTGCKTPKARAQVMSTLDCPTWRRETACAARLAVKGVGCARGSTAALQRIGFVCAAARAQPRVAGSCPVLVACPLLPLPPVISSLLP